MILILINQCSAFASYEPTWTINKLMPFNILYFQYDSSYLQVKNKIKQNPIFTPYYAPDIKNIKLSYLAEFGVNLPNIVNTEDYSANFKLYNFPKYLPSAPITDKFLNTFALSFGDVFPEIKTYISKPQNLAINVGYIAENNAIYTKKKPLETLLISKNKKFAGNFSKNIPGYLIYISPTSKMPLKSTQDDMITWSKSGVLGFDKDLIAAYKKNYCELAGVDSNYYYFLASLTKDKKINVIKVPKTITTFDNWKNLQLLAPQTKENLYLTSVLPVYSIEYIATTEIPSIIPQVDSDSFNNVFTKGDIKILAIASVANIN